MEILVHNVNLRVFANDEEGKQKIEDTLRGLLPFEDLEKEKVMINKEKVKDSEKNSIIISCRIEKRRHVRKFIDFLKENLGKENIKTLLEQIESRLDDEMSFFIRLNKEDLLNEKFELTEEGNCFHIRLTIAAYPAKKEIAKENVKKLFAE